MMGAAARQRPERPAARSNHQCGGWGPVGAIRGLALGVSRCRVRGALICLGARRHVIPEAHQGRDDGSAWPDEHRCGSPIQWR